MHIFAGVFDLSIKFGGEEEHFFVVLMFKSLMMLNIYLFVSSSQASSGACSPLANFLANILYFDNFQPTKMLVESRALVFSPSLLPYCE